MLQLKSEIEVVAAAPLYPFFKCMRISNWNFKVEFVWTVGIYKKLFKLIQISHLNVTS